MVILTPCAVSTPGYSGRGDGHWPGVHGSRRNPACFCNGLRLQLGQPPATWVASEHKRPAVQHFPNGTDMNAPGALGAVAAELTSRPRVTLG